MAASWAGPNDPYRAHISWAAARPCPSNIWMMGIIVSEERPRTGPADQISGCWAAAQPGPLHFRRRPGLLFFVGPAHHYLFSYYSGQSGPSQYLDRPGPARTAGQLQALNKTSTRLENKKSAVHRQCPSGNGRCSGRRPGATGHHGHKCGYANLCDGGSGWSWSFEGRPYSVERKSSKLT